MHDRQFIIGPEPWTVGDRWVTTPVAGGLHLSHAPDLPVREQGRRIVLGTALGTGAPESWSGRWAMVEGDRIVPDAGGTLGVLTDGTWWSSSAALLRARANRPPVPDEPPLEHRRTLHLDWYPGPGSGFVGIGRLLPGQVGHLPTGAAEPRPLPAPRAQPVDALEWAAEKLVSLVGDLDGQPVWVPLTGGYDSRVLLAAAVAAGADVETYTSLKPRGVMAAADRRLPPRLARLVGVGHRFLRPVATDAARADAWARHGAGQAVGPDRDYVVRGQWAQVPPDAVVLRGGVWGVVRGFYRPWLPPTPSPDAEALARVFGAWPAASSALAAWSAWATAHPQPGLDWRDRFFHEQRTGAWLAALEQALDVTGIERVHLACCHELLSVLLGLPDELRLRHSYQVELIRRLEPVLLRLPFNPPSTARRLWGRLAA